MVDKFGVSRQKLVTVICVLGFLGSIIFTTHAGLIFLDIVDHFLNHFGLVVVGLGECVLVGWLFRLPVMREHLNRISSIRLGVWWDIIIKYFVPILLIIVLMLDLIKEFQEPYGGYEWAALIKNGGGWLLITLIAAIVLSLQPWKTKNHEIKGRSEANEA